MMARVKVGVLIVVVAMMVVAAAAARPAREGAAGAAEAPPVTTTTTAATPHAFAAADGVGSGPSCCTNDINNNPCPPNSICRNSPSKP
ncbi:Os09g0399502 [Oryza sativa Japonica Group]|uniref:Os09g0399502 protein n=1 Tax=Oryza sativa subsp. japonica TaxID=39947 RepID=A0A0P0XLU5_ORYSJ|nr:hypothetical protein EE612_047626 [Oryza sativa]BAT07956.1 Os09g0399502 [Oryza sativa Japonica Group]